MRPAVLPWAAGFTPGRGLGQVQLADARWLWTQWPFPSSQSPLFSSCPASNSVPPPRSHPLPRSVLPPVPLGLDLSDPGLATLSGSSMLRPHRLRFLPGGCKAILEPSPTGLADPTAWPCPVSQSHAGQGPGPSPCPVSQAAPGTAQGSLRDGCGEERPDAQLHGPASSPSQPRPAPQCVPCHPNHGTLRIKGAFKCKRCRF